MTSTQETRRESYQDSLPKFNPQETAVMDYIRQGINNPEAVIEASNIHSSSVRRAFSVLLNKKKVIEVAGKVFIKGTNRNIAFYRIVKWELF